MFMSLVRRAVEIFKTRGASGFLTSLLNYTSNRVPTYRTLVSVLSYPVLFREFFDAETGAQYGVSLVDKLRLAWRIRRCSILVTGWSNFVAKIVIATKMLQIPASRDGVIVECGSHKGASTSAWSLVADAMGRELHVFDSFAGLPDPGEGDDVHRKFGEDGTSETYEMGMYEGSLEEVQQNIDRYGTLEPCTFHEGYFEETLPDYEDDIAFVFTDVDLQSSLETCLKHLWPQVVPGSYWFTHEAHQREIAWLFFDESWWNEHLRTDPPMLKGAGSGLGLNPDSGGFGSALGYTIKLDDE